MIATTLPQLLPSLNVCYSPRTPENISVASRKMASLVPKIASGVPMLQAPD